MVRLVSCLLPAALPAVRPTGGGGNWEEGVDGYPLHRGHCIPPLFYFICYDDMGTFFFFSLMGVPS